MHTALDFDSAVLLIQWVNSKVHHARQCKCQSITYYTIVVCLEY